MRSTGPGPAVPRIEATEHSFRLVVDGEPALLLGGQLHDSTPTDERLAEVLERIRGHHASVAIGSASWSLVEPEEGRFDFSTVEHLLDAARGAGLRLVVIWFGAFKNAGSTYAPGWVRADPERFPRAATAGRRTEAFTHADATAKPVLSVFSEALREADQRAFVAFMTHLRAIDAQHTVVMVQVENEVGLLKDSRDRSALAESVWRGPVPPALLRFLSEHEHTLPDAIAGAWERAGSRREDSWQEVLGDGWDAEELFMAWHSATDVQSLAGRRPLTPGSGSARAAHGRVEHLRATPPGEQRHRVPTLRATRGHARDGAGPAVRRDHMDQGPGRADRVRPDQHRGPPGRPTVGAGVRREQPLRSIPHRRHRPTAPSSSGCSPGTAPSADTPRTGPRTPWPSASRRGRTASSQRGIHQVTCASSVIVAGTSSSRTTAASIRTLTASPSASILITTRCEVVKARKTPIMMSAAQVITRPVPARPSRTDSTVSAVRT